MMSGQLAMPCTTRLDTILERQQSSPPMRTVAIRVGHDLLKADLAVPAQARGLIIFAHGSGSSRLSPRNRAVAEALNKARFATLLADLLTCQEEAADAYTRQYRFDIELLAGRLTAITDWVAHEPETRRLPVGYFGASTGAAAALVAASRRQGIVQAIVSRGGRPDLAGAALRAVTAPTLLIVGGRDPDVLQLNEGARAVLPSTAALDIVPGAAHLFEEPGALDTVTRLARAWFERHLRAPALASPLPPGG
jgi:putative phosphoribosyl transferase